MIPLDAKKALMPHLHRKKEGAGTSLNEATTM